MLDYFIIIGNCGSTITAVITKKKRKNAKIGKGEYTCMCSKMLRTKKSRYKYNMLSYKSQDNQEDHQKTR